jgi:CheY-like chemotaxis protein
MLQEQFPEGDPRRQFASDIRRASGRAADLTRQLLTFSRRTVVAPKVIDVNVVVKDVGRMLRRVLGEDIELVVDLDPGVKSIFIDPGSLEQIVMNLCVNARDAMPRGGRLTIRTNHDQCPGGLDATGKAITLGEYVRVIVADTGEGIPPDVCAHIFEPFFTTKEIGKGTGLGLATVYGIVKQHQGWIEVESKLNQGATFQVFLPCLEPNAEPEGEPATEVEVCGGTETILVVEDETPVRELVCELLASYGYQVIQAESGVRALELWKACRDKVDLMLTDLVMPHRVNGRQLAERFWAERPKLKVIFTSGYSAEVVGKDFVLHPGVQYLQKPYAPNLLASKVRACLDSVANDA